MLTIQECRVRCNYCENVFYENELIYNEEENVEICPYCRKGGCIADIDENE